VRGVLQKGQAGRLFGMKTGTQKALEFWQKGERVGEEGSRGSFWPKKIQKESSQLQPEEKDGELLGRKKNPQNRREHHHK